MTDREIAAADADAPARCEGEVCVHCGGDAREHRAAPAGYTAHSFSGVPCGCEAVGERDVNGRTLKLCAVRIAEWDAALDAASLDAQFGKEGGK